MMRPFTKLPKFSAILFISGLILLLSGIVLASPAQAQDSQDQSPLHPVFPMLDAEGKNVLESGSPVSTLKTCGACHDTAFIVADSAHSDGALIAFGADGSKIASPTGDLEDLGWKPGAVEMNCFLCHTASPDNSSRLAAIKTGDFGWANTATLVGSGIVTAAEGKYTWNPAAFDPQGNLLPAFVTIQDPRSENCGLCHGIAHTNPQIPLTLGTLDGTLDLSRYNTLTTGQVVSPQKIAQSGVNLADKNTLDRSWDVHAERVLVCVDCHYSLNNPVYYQELATDRPEHLDFDPRRIDFGEYLKRPLHQFARGEANAATDSSAAFTNTMRRCETCHDAASTHTWLPYEGRHEAALACESCHIPRLYAPALQNVDWTVIKPDGSARLIYRGVEGDGYVLDANTLITGFEPVLLPRQNRDGSHVLAPFNLITIWNWVAGDPPQPVTLTQLRSAYLEGEHYHPEVLAVFDANSNQSLSDQELVIDNDAKKALITQRLESLGLVNPHIVGETQAFSINHNVTRGEWAIKECRTCHGNDSKVTAAMVISPQNPGGVQPTFIGEAGALLQGTNWLNRGETLFLQPNIKAPEVNVYVFGHDAVVWIDLLGMLAFMGTLAGVFGHSTLRYLAARKRAKTHGAQERMYLYTVYERFWHWLQTAVILGLLFTGLVIHRPGFFTLFDFHFIVLTHNILALILVINAALAAFYHLVSGEIRQFLPEPRGFFNDAIKQAKFYLRGIFKGDPHPFEKKPGRKMNPLQQITYLMILNVLLPAQVITGALMWGAQHFPDATERLGGLPLLAPLHTLVAWMFAAFIVGHVYLTTTGHEPLTNIKAMMFGWEDVEKTGSEPELKAPIGD
ncbi:MAG: cytochrome b/b6 domain-containing protein [Anaerolinea sp.]|nr:cytochrome b/b6 domain-containing protein [Anaerolinea sp.]